MKIEVYITAKIIDINYLIQIAKHESRSIGFQSFKKIYLSIPMTNHRDREMHSTRQRRARINDAINAALSGGMPSQNSHTSDPMGPLNVIRCTTDKLGPIIGRNGAICPYCSSVLKNKATLYVHMKKCRLNHNSHDIREEEATDLPHDPPHSSHDPSYGDEVVPTIPPIVHAPTINQYPAFYPEAVRQTYDTQERNTALSPVRVQQALSMGTLNAPVIERFRTPSPSALIKSY